MMRAGNEDVERWVVSNEGFDFAVELMPDLLDGVPPWLARESRARRRLVILDRGFAREWGQPVRKWIAADGAIVSVVVMRFSERRKNMRAVYRVLTEMSKAGLRRADELIVFAGGNGLDVCGVAAGLFLKGIRYYIFPSTPLSMGDAGAALKRAVNGRLKNEYGVYHPAAVSWVYPGFARTLPKREMLRAMPEILKVGHFYDAALFARTAADGAALIERRFDHDAGVPVIGAAIGGIMDYFQRDATDRIGERWPNGGHKIGPVLEARTKFRGSHGDAVSVDLALSLMLSELMGHTSQDVARQMLGVSRQLGVRVWQRRLASRKFVLSAVESIRDQGGGKLLWPVVDGEPGTARFVEPSGEQVWEAARVLRRLVA